MRIPDSKQRLADQPSQEAASQSRVDPHRGENTNELMTDGFLMPSLDVLADEAQPPAYGEQHDQVHFSQPGFDAGAQVTDDGRININLHTKNRRLADLLAPAIHRQVSVVSQSQSELPPAYIPPGLASDPGQPPPLCLNIVIQIVGSRGDVQPFVALGKVLKDLYGHRIRIATHATFKAFVEENDLEFFSIGGDPTELMAFMVKNPGLMPGFDSLKSGEISRRRRGIQEMLTGCWRSCVEAGDGTGPPPEPHRADEPLDVTAASPGPESIQPFVADAIIANPPSFAHIHVAEKLGIPVHMMFTMPWSPTKAFPHPLANIQSSNADDVLTRYMTYTLVEMMTWQGLGDIVNRFREKALGLPPLSFIWAPGLLNRLKIPYTYCWSPALIPKPNDWGKHIDISGFFFLNLASTYTPDPDLEVYLDSGPPPIYIGFGSIVVDDPNAMTRMIFDAVRSAGVRAIVSKGWGGLGADAVGIPEGVFMIGNVPHDWLFDHVSAVIHHGGAGTTAAGIKAGKPTFVVPFFGDQLFWGAMIARAEAGPEPIRYKDLSVEKLVKAIKICLNPGTQTRARDLGEKIRQEAGTNVGAKSFHKHLDMDSMRCFIAPSRVAVWRVRRTEVRLSPLAMAVLVDAGELTYQDVKLLRHTEHNTESQPPDPVSAGAASLIGDISGVGLAIADIPRDLFKSRCPRDAQSQDTRDAVALPQKESSIRTNSQTEAIDAAGSSMVSCRGDIISTEVSRQPGERIRTADSSGPLPSVSSSETLKGDFGQPRFKTPSDATSRASPIYPSAQQPAGAKPETSSIRSPSPMGLNIEASIEAGQSVGRAVSTGVKSPMNFCLGLAKGFRNLPRLYNDDTVRPIEKVTDLSSGIMIAGKELGYGFVDGITGLVMQPIKGAEKDGPAGFVKGIGKGIGGIIAKPSAGIWGVPAYVMQGMHAEVNKKLARSVMNYVNTSRIMQGKQDLSEASQEEKTDILTRWNGMKRDTQNLDAFKQLNKKASVQVKASTGFETLPSRNKNTWLYSEKNSIQHDNVPEARQYDTQEATLKSPISNPMSSIPETGEFEQAIQFSVRETSRGNDEEDAAVEAAIRESLRAVRAREAAQENSREFGKLAGRSPSIFEDEEYRITEEEYHLMIEQAIQRSMAVEREDSANTSVGEKEGCNKGAHPRLTRLDSRDAELQRAIEESKNESHSLQRGDEAELRQAIEASVQQMNREQAEEEVVLEFVRKQSMAEEEFRQQMNKGKEKAYPRELGEDEDELLKRALEESLRMQKTDSAGPSASGQTTQTADERG